MGDRKECTERTREERSDEKFVKEMFERSEEWKKEVKNTFGQRG